MINRGKVCAWDDFSIYINHFSAFTKDRKGTTGAWYEALSICALIIITLLFDISHLTVVMSI